MARDTPKPGDRECRLDRSMSLLCQWLVADCGNGAYGLLDTGHEVGRVADDGLVVLWCGSGGDGLLPWTVDTSGRLGL